MPTLPATPLPISPFFERLLAFLIPFFSGFTTDLAAARAEAMETLASYGARTRAELLCAVQIIVFSFAALETMAEAQTPQMSPSMRIRFRGCGNNLNRSSQKTEHTLARRLACDAPKATDIQAEPVADVTDDVAEEIMQQTQAAIQDHRARAAARRAPADTTSASPGNAPDNDAANDVANLPACAPDPTRGPRPEPNPRAQPVPLTPTRSSPVGQPSALRPQDHAVSPTQKEKNQRLWGAAMMETLAQMGMPVKPASET